MSAIRSLGGQFEELAPDHTGMPGHINDEALQGLIMDWLGEAREHGLHRLALAVADQARNDAAQRDDLSRMTEAGSEPFKPPVQVPNNSSGAVGMHPCEAQNSLWKSTRHLITADVHRVSRIVSV